MSFIVRKQSISSRIGYLIDFPIWLLPKWHTWNYLGKIGMFHLKLLINFLSLSIVGQIDWHAFENSEGRLVQRWSQADLQPCSIKQILLACCVPGALTHFCTDTHSGSPGGTPQSSWQLTTTATSLWCLMKTYLLRLKMSSVKLYKNFKISVCCPTPRHVTIKLFRNIHY